MHRYSRNAFVRPKNLVSSLALSCLVAGGGTAHAAEPGDWYIAGAVTRSKLDRPRQTIANAPTPGSTLRVVNDVDSGWGGQAEIGYTWDFFRVEAEMGRTANHSNHYSTISPIAVTLPQDGKNTVMRYMVNAYVELPRGRWPVSPFLGAGVGATHAHATTFAAPARAPNAPPSQILDIKDTRVAYQLMGGASVPVTSHLTLTAQYRWFDGGTFRGSDARGERATRTLHGSNVDVGLRLAF